MQVSQSELMSPPPLRKLSDTGLTPVMMRDILLKTVFRKNVEKASEIAKGRRPAHPAGAGVDRQPARTRPDAGHGYAASRLPLPRWASKLTERRQGAGAGCAVAIGILRADARPARRLQGAGQAPVDP